MSESFMSAPAEGPLPEGAYVGNELELFAHARNWKRYWGAIVASSLRGDVLEVGAGLGANTRLLRPLSPNARRWVCLEPDSRLLDQLRIAPPQGIEPRLGTLANLARNELFDAILYIDVLEHIPDDAAELRHAAAHLREHGRLIVLSPAHQWLFSPFDSAIGHCRRYTRRSLKRAAGGIGSLRLEHSWYLDSFGFFASAANRLLLRQSMPTLRQILFWDRLLVPISRLLDPLLFRCFGKSVIAIWTTTHPQ
jgi:SAM-dependent methyltransferase